MNGWEVGKPHMQIILGFMVSSHKSIPIVLIIYVVVQFPGHPFRV